VPQIIAAADVHAGSITCSARTAPLHVAIAGTLHVQTNVILAAEDGHSSDDDDDDDEYNQG